MAVDDDDDDEEDDEDEDDEEDCFFAAKGGLLDFFSEELSLSVEENEDIFCASNENSARNIDVPMHDQKN